MSASSKTNNDNIIRVNASGSLYMEVSDLEQTQEYKEFTESIRSLKFANELAVDIKEVGRKIKTRLAATNKAEALK
jgi:hypothetical protein